MMPRLSVRRSRVRLALPILLAVISACATRGAGSPALSPTPPAPSPATPAAAAPLTVSPTSPIKEFGTMWTFDSPPLAYWKARYNFEASPQWLDRVRLSAVRIPGCSASIVSANGLVLTNHHCARECTTELSTPDSNYIETGFVAGTVASEKRCAGMTADQLQSIEDVTAQVRGGITSPNAAEQGRQRDAVVARIQGECSGTTGLLCQVVSLYQGGRYSVYRFKRYTDLRLVMAPEGDVAFFGGDPDNFTYPRYDLDLTLLRIYDNGVPLKAEHYLKWSEAGAIDGELAFVIGNPGSTGRLNTVAQMEYLRDVQYLNTLDQLKRQVAALRVLVQRADEQTKRRYQDEIFSIDNSVKAYTGYRSGLLDSALMARKAAFERDFRGRVAASPDTRARYGGAWDAIARANRERATFATKTRFYGMGGQQLLPVVLAMVRFHLEEAKPDSLRLPAFRGAGLNAIRTNIARPIPFDVAVEEAFLATHLEAALAALGPNDPYLRSAMGGKTPADAARAMFAGTKVTDAAARRALLDGGAAAITASTDPLVVLARVLEPFNREVTVRTQAIQADLAANAEKIGQAIFAAYGTMLPPDATFTLRISDGVVKGYPMNGTIAAYQTSMYGLYGRSADFDQKPPFALPQRWLDRRERLDLRTPLNFVTTNDIIGGNSGSPVVNRAGEVIGLIFDSNIEGLPNNFIFTDEAARAISVHSRAITAALRAIYDAGRIADELEGRGR